MKKHRPTKLELIKRMSQLSTPKRTLEQIQSEYQMLCARAGDMQYKVRCFNADLESINQRLVTMNQEAQQLSKDDNNGQTSSSAETGTSTDQQTTSETSVPASVS